jgi:hypothetical protein
MVRYFYAWTPLATIVATVVLLSSPYLALIALMVVSLAAVAAVAWAIVSVPLMLRRTIRRRWQSRSGAEWTNGAPAASPARAVLQQTPPVPAGATMLLAGPPSEKDA